MSEYEPGITVVVVNYRTPEDLQEFCESFVMQDYPANLVIENVCPNERDIEIGHQFVKQYEKSHHIVWSDNIGYAASVNHGSRLANTEVIAAFNADVILPTSDTLKQCVDRLMSQPSWGVLGPIQVDQQGRLTHAGIYGTPDKPSFEGSWHKPPQEKHHVLREAVSVAGSAYFMKRQMWDELRSCSYFTDMFPHARGAFPTFQHYYEDMYLSLHARAHGWKVIYDGTVEPLIHKWHRASPIGGEMDRQMPKVRDQFREACAYHGIICE